MSLQSADSGAGRTPTRPLRLVRDAHRPSISSVEAAERLGRSRSWVTEQIQSGGIDGYGVQGEYRTRWYAYVDALPSPVGPPDDEAVRDVKSHVVSLIDRLVNLVHQERRLRVEAFGAMQEALDQMSQARDEALCEESASSVSLAESAAESAIRARKQSTAATLRGADLDAVAYALGRLLPASNGQADDER